MDELVQQIVQRTGIPEDKARMAVQVVAGYLEKRLPGPVASQISAQLGAGGASSSGAGALGDAAKGLGGMFGR